MLTTSICISRGEGPWNSKPAARDLVAVIPIIKKRSKVIVPHWQKSLHGEVVAIGEQRGRYRCW